MAISLLDRIRGCLIGGACGDALGAPVEFLSDSEIADLYGPRGITDFAEAYGRRGAITDDTQMTMFTVEGLIRARVAERRSEVPVDRTILMHKAYLRWLATQGSTFEQGYPRPDLDGWLVSCPGLWFARAPGMTCLSALRFGKRLGPYADNDSKGCGTVMRDAPWGLYFAGDPENAFAGAAQAARITHGHPSAAYASGAVAAIVARLCTGSSIEAAARDTLAQHLQAPAAKEVADALSSALAIAGREGWRSGLIELGQGWVAEEALAIALLCAIGGETPRDALIAAVNHSGDSDSTGAICGNLLGAAFGIGALPQDWVAEVELADELGVLSADLAQCLRPDFDAEAFEQVYPG